MDAVSIGRLPRPRTAQAALASGAARLGAAGVPEPRRDARLLLAHALGARPEALIAAPEKELDAAQAEAYSRLIARRAAREPVSRILGRREFWSLEFRITPDAFDPRPDSETVVAAVLDWLPARDARLRLLDLGTGSGCLLISLLSELPNAWGLGIDCSAGAVRTARANAEALGFGSRAHFAVGHWGTAVNGAFNVVVTNPPYIAEADIAALAAEVAGYEPYHALAAGADGLGAYRALAADLPRLLAPGGVAAIEIGDGQAARVAPILRRAGLALAEARRDLAGTVRCLVAREQEKQPCQDKKGVGKRGRPD